MLRASLKDGISQTTKERKAKFNDLIFIEDLSTKKTPSNYSIPFLSWLDTKSINAFCFLIQIMNTDFQEPNQNSFFKNVFFFNTLKEIYND